MPKSRAKIGNTYQVVVRNSKTSDTATVFEGVLTNVKDGCIFTFDNSVYPEQNSEIVLDTRTTDFVIR